MQWLPDAAEVVDDLAVEERDDYAALEGEIEGVMDGDLFRGVRQGGMLERGEEPTLKGGGGRLGCGGGSERIDAAISM